jgi:3-hydroxymyristoyl/3-hydroxydecanoyl-(acyl carrier protein) dehydratase
MSAGLLDRIIQVDSDRIRAMKNLSYRETYLMDHFPGFPLMPGALQLETLIQAGQWLLREKLEFPAADFLPRSFRNTRYSRFVLPGDRLEIEVELTGERDGVFTMKGTGTVQGDRAVVARFELVRYSATWDRGLTDAEREARRQALRDQFRRLRQKTLPRYPVSEEAHP